MILYFERLKYLTEKVTSWNQWCSGTNAQVTVPC